jgi:hypothetical protein
MSISDLTWVDEHSGACHKKKMNGRWMSIVGHATKKTEEWEV